MGFSHPLRLTGTSLGSPANLQVVAMFEYSALGLAGRILAFLHRGWFLGSCGQFVVSHTKCQNDCVWSQIFGSHILSCYDKILRLTFWIKVVRNFWFPNLFSHPPPSLHLPGHLPICRGWLEVLNMLALSLAGHRLQSPPRVVIWENR